MIFQYFGVRNAQNYFQTGTLSILAAADKAE